MNYSEAIDDLAAFRTANNELVTEDLAALRFATLYEGKLRFCHDHKAWFEWTGAIWRKNSTELAFHWARELARDLVVEGQEKTKVTAGKAAFAAAIERLARSDPKLAVTAEIWDQNPFLLGTPCGTVDLKTGLPRPARPQDGITKITAVFHPTARIALCGFASSMRRPAAMRRWSDSCGNGPAMR